MKTIQLVYICLLLLSISFLSAKYSEAFVNGAYTEWSLEERPELINALSDYLHIAKSGYNLMQVTTTSAYPIIITNVLNNCDNDSLDVMLIDYKWSNATSNEVGLAALSNSHYYRYEAEYKCPNETLSGEDELKDKNFSYFDHTDADNLNIGRNIFDFGDYSNNYAWSCSEDSLDSASMVLHDLRWRWYNNNPNQTGNTDPVGPEFRFLRDYYHTYSYSSNPIFDENRIYITYRLKWNEIGYDPNAIIAIASLQLYTNNVVPTPVTIPLSPLTGFTYDDTLRVRDLTHGIIAPNEFYDFTFCTDMTIQQMADAHLLSGTISSTSRSFIQIEPRLYWNGVSTLTIDYVDIEDKLHRSLRASELPDIGLINYYSKLTQRISTLTGCNIASGNLRYLYSRDEPTAPQFDSYNLLQNFSDNPSNHCPQIITCTNFNNKNKIRLDGTKFNNPILHLNGGFSDVSPHQIMIDLYPIQSYTKWNQTSNGNENFIQTSLDNSMLNYYKECKRKTIELEVNKKLYVVPQTFGTYDSNGWSDHLKPPKEMQKCLKLLPLCYGVDGIVDYIIVPKNISTDINRRYTPLEYNIVNGVNVIQSTAEFNQICEANAKINIYGPITKELAWLDADSIMVNGDHEGEIISQVYLNSLTVLDDNNPTTYDGYVQCGYYKNRANNYPSLMLVNRRAVYKTENGNFNDNFSVTPAIFDTSFTTAGQQSVRIEFTEDVNSSLQINNLALYDPNDKSLYIPNNNVVIVPIGAGDGKLLQTVSTLPPTVTSNITISDVGYLQGNITISNGAIVTFLPNSNITLYPNTHITIQYGSTLSINGIVAVGDSSSIINNGGTLNINNTTCKFDYGTSIVVNSADGQGENGTLHVTNSLLENSSDASSWTGIQANYAHDIRIENSVFKNALAGIHSRDSNLHLKNNRFEIPHIQNSNQPYQSCGVFVYNSLRGKVTQVTSDNNHSGFYGDSAVPLVSALATGLYVMGPCDSLSIKNQNFQNLHYGVHIVNSYEPGDSISSCIFNNCVKGIYLMTGYYSGTITDCSFTQSSISTPNQMIGIHMINTAPVISNCVFNYCQGSGILSEQSTFVGTKVVANCSFNNCRTGLESSYSNIRVAGSYFDYNDTGMLCHAGSNLNLTHLANNRFKSKTTNIMFTDSRPYKSYIQIVKGHNDFYHYRQPETELLPSDFSFDDNYFNGYQLEGINADCNWFESNRVLITPHECENYVKIVHYDSEPNSIAPPPEDNRYMMALQYEIDLQYEQARALYKDIINSPLYEEEQYIGSCLDGLYRISLNQNYPVSENINYFNEKVLQYAVSDPYLSKLLQSYLLKEFIVGKDFQSAIDLIQPRIDNPISEIDSLRAVLDLEIILQLATFENSKKPLTTTYYQYKYPDVATFSKKHDEHWNEMIELLNKQDDEGFPIPIVATLYNNYPNPFNPSTTIAFAIPQKAQVKIKMYNIKGQIVKQLCNETMVKGHHKLVWDGRNEQGRPASSGIYLIRMETKDKVITKKTMMLK